MKNPLSFIGLVAVVCLVAAAQSTTIAVGSGAPNEGIRLSFIQDYFRNNFNNLVVVPPVGNVKALGSQGLVQEFTDIKNSANKYALVKPNVNAPALAGGADMVQMYPALYSYYTSLGPTVAGYPVNDTMNCPGLVNTPNNSCQYEWFDKPYALFAYSSPILGTSNFALANPFYAKWQAVGGIAIVGPATSAAAAITSASGIAATVQTFDQGGIFNITSGVLAGRLVAVGPGVWATYVASGGYGGFLGLPITDEQLLPSGLKQQSFEGGSIQYDPTGATAATILYPIASITVSPSGPLQLSLGAAATLTAAAFDPNGATLANRSLVWTTSNQNVVSVQPAGQTATVKATGGGTATITVSGGGKSSPPVTIVVTAPCCSLGQGAPSPAIQQAFQDAVMRNRLNVTLPTAASLMRLGNGYVQSVVDSTGASVLLALSDKGSAAYVVAGAILTKYLQLGGPAGLLGYPASDADAAGRQLFENQAALAGDPVLLVSGGFLAKWSALGYEAGIAGNPTSAAVSVLSFAATLGSMQSFANGVMVATQSGPRAGQVFYVGGPIGAAYLQAGGPAGSLGLPISDQGNHQEFEGGSIDYAAGDAVAQVHPGTRTPMVTATPSAVLAGSLLRLAVGGFAPGATLRVSVSGQPDFTVNTASGAYVWQTLVPSTAKSGTVTIHAADTGSTASADGSYMVETASELALKLTKAAGDGQTGSPGATLPQALDVLVTDTSGNPVPGVAVQFSASPGAAILMASAATDSNGHAQASVSLPAAEGLALFSVTAGKQVTTFGAQALHSTLANFPQLTQPSAQAGLATAVAAIVRYYQARGDLPMTSGLPNPASGDPVATLWGLGLRVSIERPDLGSIRTLVGEGMPVLVGVGAHYVVAIGVNADGSIAVMDPVTGGPATLTGTPTAAIRLIPHAAAAHGFVLSGAAPFQVASPAGACGNTLRLDSLEVAYCDGSQGQYQADVSTSGAFHLILMDLSASGGRTDLAGSGLGSFSITQGSTGWVGVSQTAGFSAAGVVDAASYSAALAPGGLFTVFGTGLAGPGVATSVTVNGEAVRVVAAGPFQVSGVVPGDLGPGVYSLTIASASGSATQQITLVPAAPAIFVVVNQDGSINTPGNPAKRGQAVIIYSTGLGAGGIPVSVILGGATLKPFYAGATAGFPGLYQVNVSIPLGAAPGSGQELHLAQGGVASNSVAVAVQ